MARFRKAIEGEVVSFILELSIKSERIGPNSVVLWAPPPSSSLGLVLPTWP